MRGILTTLQGSLVLNRTCYLHCSCCMQEFGQGLWFKPIAWNSILFPDQVRTRSGEFYHTRRIAIFPEKSFWTNLECGTSGSVIEGCITATQCLYWTICLVKRELAACCKSPLPSETKFSATMLIELMGDSNPRADVPAAPPPPPPYSRKAESVIPRARQDQRMT